MIALASSYLRGYARHPADRAVDLMPRDAVWTKAVHRLYDKLPDDEKMVLDSYAEDCPSIGNRTRERLLKRIALKLIIEAGYESEYTILMI